VDPARLAGARGHGWGPRGHRALHRVELQARALDALAGDDSSRVYPEPVPGRGRALLEWVCADPKFHQIIRECHEVK
jgi:hypothetical protein